MADVLKRVPVREQDAKERAANFEEVCYGYNKEEAMEEATRCLNCKNAKCIEGCPVAINIPGFISQVKEGNIEEAYKVIGESSALPAICGRICNRRCEAACTRGTVDEAVAIDAIKKFVAEQDLHEETRYIPPVVIASNRLTQWEQKIAIIGAGPAGLSAAYYLAVKGYKPTVFEKNARPGGMMTYGIPSYKLEKDVIEAEIEVLRELGVEIRCGVEIGKDILLDELREEGYKAFYIAIGCQGGKIPEIPGNDAEGIDIAVSFLHRAAEDNTQKMSGKVVVIGGGNVAVDCARTAYRFGGSGVAMYCLESRETMPATEEEIAEALDSGLAVRDITFIPGTVYRTKEGDLSAYDPVILPSFDEICADRGRYAKSFMTQYENTDPYTARPLAEPYPNKVLVVQNPPAAPLTTQEMDDIYAYPYAGTYHPDYEKSGGVPAIQEIRFSLTSCRGCFGGCSFCALTFHQGRMVQVRSHESILQEAERMTKDPEFKGYIHDVGGPTGNFRRPSCEKQTEKGVCLKKQCLFPKPCQNLQVDHTDYVKLLRRLKKLPGVKKVFVRSGIRFDYVMADRDDTFLRELCRDHISGQLRVAPEHVSDKVLRAMGKPPHKVYRQFLERYERVNKLTGKKQYAVPYLMSSHPGSTLKEAVELAEYIRDLGYMPEQVQDFYPTPSTMSTVMYYTGIDPVTTKRVYVCKNPHEKAMQRALIQYRNPKNYELVREALKLAGRDDLIGFDKKCLIKPRKLAGEAFQQMSKSQKPKGTDKFSKKCNNRNNRKETEKHTKKKTIRNTHKKKT